MCISFELALDHTSTPIPTPFWYLYAVTRTTFGIPPLSPLFDVHAYRHIPSMPVSALSSFSLLPYKFSIQFSNPQKLNHQPCQVTVKLMCSCHTSYFNTQQALADVGLLTQAELESCIVSEFNPVRWLKTTSAW